MSTMSPSWSSEYDGNLRAARIATEYEFLGEPNLSSPETMKQRIAEQRREIEEAHHSIRTLLALTKLSLEELE